MDSVLLLAEGFGNNHATMDPGASADMYYMARPRTAPGELTLGQAAGLSPLEPGEERVVMCSVHNTHAAFHAWERGAASAIQAVDEDAARAFRAFAESRLRMRAGLEDRDGPKLLAPGQPAAPVWTAKAAPAKTVPHYTVVDEDQFVEARQKAAAGFQLAFATPGLEAAYAASA